MQTFFVSGTLMQISHGWVEIGVVSGTLMQISHGWLEIGVVSGTLMFNPSPLLCGELILHGLIIH